MFVYGFQIQDAWFSRPRVLPIAHRFSDEAITLRPKKKKRSIRPVWTRWFKKKKKMALSRKGKICLFAAPTPGTAFDGRSLTTRGGTYLRTGPVDFRPEQYVFDQKRRGVAGRRFPLVVRHVVVGRQSHSGGGGGKRGASETTSRP